MAEIAERGIRIGQSRVGASVARISFDRLLEVFGGFLQTNLGPLIPLIAAFDIELVGFGALGPYAHFGHLADEAIAALGNRLDVSGTENSSQHRDVSRQAALLDVGVTPDLLE